ncbi:MAG: hypothetical protein KGQ41_08255, partial [Alphaproteobacteria bacterium]|nr:hypothetical protein [Alphaproteobacteria bacterium]
PMDALSRSDTLERRMKRQLCCPVFKKQVAERVWHARLNRDVPGLTLDAEDLGVGELEQLARQLREHDFSFTPGLEPRIIQKPRAEPLPFVHGRLTFNP